MLEICWRQHRGKTALAVGLVLAGTLAMPLVALAMRWLTDAVVTGRATRRSGPAWPSRRWPSRAFRSPISPTSAYFELAELNVLEFDRGLNGAVQRVPGPGPP